MATPRVSIIVPVYNGAAHLPELFNRLADQTWKEFEVVIADDASTDDSLARARQLAGTAPFPVAVLEASRNGGPAAARNRGIGAARGEIVAFCDVDDRWMPQKLSRQLQLFDARPELTIVGAQGTIRMPDGGAIGMLIPDSVFRMPDPRLALFWDAFLQTSSVTARRAAIPPNGFDESFQIGEDRDLFIRLAMEGRLGLIEEPMFDYVRVPESTMVRKAVTHRRDTIRMIRLNLKRYGDRLSPAQRRFALGKAYYDAGEALIDPPHSQIGGAPYLARAAALGYRPGRCASKALSLLARRTGLKRAA